MTTDREIKILEDKIEFIKRSLDSGDNCFDLDALHRMEKILEDAKNEKKYSH